MFDSFPSGLDHRSFGLRRVLLFRGVQVSAERAHERDQPRDRANFGALDEAAEVPETLLRADEADADFRSVLPGRCECCAEEV